MDKKEQRKFALAARNSLSAAQRREYSTRICARLIQTAEVQNAQLVLSYMATASEVDLSDVHDWLRGKEIRTVFPRCEDAHIMNAWEPFGWIRNDWGILEPDPDCSEPVAPEELDLVLVPCVAFDATGTRLGHGAGYYDRYLPKCERACHIMVAFEAQRMEHLPRDPYDFPVDMIVTEKTLYRIKL